MNMPAPNTVSDQAMAMVTLACRRDLDRCRLLKETISHYVVPRLRHYIVVDRRDARAFRPLRDAYTEVLYVEDLLPWWIFRPPGWKHWWASLKSLPVRNWILQQLVKLAVPRFLYEPVLMYVDTDVAFVKSFNPYSLLRNGLVPLLRVPGANNVPMHNPWHRTAGRLLGLAPSDYYGSSHIGNLIMWVREHVLQLQEHIESITGKPWLVACSRRLHLSEYILYGVFVEHILGQRARHYFEDRVICLGHWGERPMTKAEIADFLAGVKDWQVAVMISSKANIPVDVYRDLII